MNMLCTLLLAAQVYLSNVELNTYPFSDPDPVPATAEKRWPYFRYDGSSATGTTQRWEAVVLENEKIKVTVVPAIGGKIWGATDKKTGRDFIYFNHAAKFRNIALCGPWTSGGIEFNFGLIGHTPSTSTPIDWCVRTNDDHSVSYFCSNTELINRTTWQVEVRLGKDDSFFTTRSLWHNGSLLPTPYYHWMNAAYSTRADPELVFPGAFYVGHDGDAHPWPIDEKGRDIRFVNNNNFGSSKSYHVCGGDTRLYGVWWKEWGMGSYHKNEFGEKYGRKAWIWALSREGGIWEDLLTDTDGQYMELQSGRVFNQPRRLTWKTPFKHPVFHPGVADSFSEQWGVWHDKSEFENAWNKTNYVERAEKSPDDFDWTSAYGLFLRGEQALREKDDALAEEYLEKSLAKERYFAPALAALSELNFRRARYAEAVSLAERSLSINAYDAAANYVSGLVAKERGEDFKALERLGLAAFSPAWRPGAFAEMSKIYLARKEYQLALDCAKKCLASSRNSIDGWALKVLALRKIGKLKEADRSLSMALEIWPLSRVLLALKGNEAPTRNELAHEVDIETGLWFLSCGEKETARKYFSQSKSFVGDLMKCYLSKDVEALKSLSSRSVRFAFAFRRESLKAIDWAVRLNGHWKFRFLRAQFAAANGDTALAKKLLDGIDNADDAVFYLYRKNDGDLDRAAKLEDSWRVGRAKMKAFAEKGDWRKVEEIGRDYLSRYPKCDAIEILYSNALIKLKEYKKCIEFLDGVEVLPSEFGDNATDIYHAAQDALKIERTWPERLGKGKPYSN